jgi:hypothetical protein
LGKDLPFGEETLPFRIRKIRNDVFLIFYYDVFCLWTHVVFHVHDESVEEPSSRSKKIENEIEIENETLIF